MTVVLLADCSHIHRNCFNFEVPPSYGFVVFSSYSFVVVSFDFVVIGEGKNYPAPSANLSELPLAVYD